MSALKSLFGSSVSIEVGTLADVRLHIQRLLEAPRGGFLIIEVSGRPQTTELRFAGDGLPPRR